MSTVVLKLTVDVFCYDSLCLMVVIVNHILFYKRLNNLIDNTCLVGEICLIDILQKCRS